MRYALFSNSDILYPNTLDPLCHSGCLTTPKISHTKSPLVEKTPSMMRLLVISRAGKEEEMLCLPTDALC